MFVEARTYRFVGHSRSDPGKYRPAGELERWRERDPLLVAEPRLDGRARARAAIACSEVGRRCRARAREVEQAALAAPFPEPHDRFSEFDGDERRGRHRRRRPRSARRHRSARSLRAERERRGLSLRELARRLEVSPSLVSQIETGKTQPSVRTLYAIVTELGVSLDELFAPAATTTRPRRGRCGRRRTTPTAVRTGRDYGRVQRADERSVIDLELRRALGAADDLERPGRRLPLRGLRGRAAPRARTAACAPQRTRVRDRAHRAARRHGRLRGHVLGPGDSISFDSSIPHRLHNDGDEVATAIWIVLGRHHDPGR